MRTVPVHHSRGLLATFMNKYALSHGDDRRLVEQIGAHRVNETAIFFTETVMPDVLDRHGAAFKDAAMVRLMHAMVRFNILSRGDRWDVKTYGIPIPQVDQMPAGLMSIFIIARNALRRGRTVFTPDERAHVELARYRCFLLGLPRDLLADTPQAVVDLLLTRHATLRKGFDDNCAALVHACSRPISPGTTRCAASCTLGWSADSPKCSLSKISSAAAKPPPPKSASTWAWPTTLPPPSRAS